MHLRTVLCACKLPGYHAYLLQTTCTRSTSDVRARRYGHPCYTASNDDTADFERTSKEVVTACSIYFLFPMAQQPRVDQGLLIIEPSRSHSVGLLWTSDKPDGGTSS
jgi:hypothetical protein